MILSLLLAPRLNIVLNFFVRRESELKENVYLFFLILFFKVRETFKNNQGFFLFWCLVASCMYMHSS